MEMPTVSGRCFEHKAVSATKEAISMASFLITHKDHGLPLGNMGQDRMPT
jgi:hypothetical protein